MAKSTDVCIFCGNGRPTKEHIYGRWLRHHINIRDANTIHQTSYTGGGKAKVGPSLGVKPSLHRPGAPSSHQLRVACRSCNGGWMGDFQNKGGKKFLPPLIDGCWPLLSHEAMLKLSCWATMVTMVFEYADEYTISITQQERTAFMEALSPPETFQVYLGLYIGNNSPGSTYHRAGSILDNDRTLNIGSMQATTIHVGGCFFHVLSAPIGVLPNPRIFANEIGMCAIWPIPNIAPNRPNVIFDPLTWWIHTKHFRDLGVYSEPHFGMLVKPGPSYR